MAVLEDGHVEDFPVIVVSLVLMLMPVPVHSPVIWYSYTCGISLTCVFIYCTIRPFPLCASCDHIFHRPTNYHLTNHLSSRIPIPLITPPLLLPFVPTNLSTPNRSSAEPAPEVVSPRSESNSWTTLTDPSSETSRAPCESMTFWRFWSLSERLGEFFAFFVFSLSRLVSSYVCRVVGEGQED